MKKFLWTLMLAGILIIAGCGGSDDSSAEEENTTEVNNETENNEVEESTEDTEEEPVEEEPAEEANTEQSEGNSNTSGLDQASRELPDLKLQVQKADEEAGITVENNEIYSQLVDVINADPKAGVPNDFSVYPHDIVRNEDGSSSLLFIAVNRVNKPIRNISFDLTLGDKEGNYIFERQEVILDENGVGILQPHSAVPFLLGITAQDEEIYSTLTNTNVEIRLDDAQVDYAE